MIARRLVRGLASGALGGVLVVEDDVIIRLAEGPVRTLFGAFLDGRQTR
jgi:hypothetical protein